VSNSTPRYVVDSCGLIAYLRGEKGAEKMALLLLQGAEGDAALSMHAVNLGEVYYDSIRVEGEGTADELLDSIEACPSTSCGASTRAWSSARAC
jgi:hypothetical protein